MSDFTPVCKLSDIAKDTGVCALVDGKQIAIFRFGSDDKLFAINNYDPFSGANVLSRGLVGSVGNRPKVSSPLLKQAFDLETGICFDNDEVIIDTYPVKLEGDIVLVSGIAQPKPETASA